MMDSHVDITGIDRATLLQELCISRIKAIKHPLFEHCQPPSYEQCKAAIQNLTPDYPDYGRIDYFMGICIKTNLLDNIIDSYLYNRNPHHETMQEIVKRLRSGKCFSWIFIPACVITVLVLMKIFK